MLDLPQINKPDRTYTLYTIKGGFMRGRSWKNVAKRQFDGLPDEYKDDWEDLHKKTVHRK